jgi:hypothetical protein
MTTFFGLAGVVGTILTVIALGVAINQFRKTASIAQAAQAAVERAERQLASNRLLLVVPQLENLQLELEQAIETNSRSQARKVLLIWRREVSQLIGLLSARADLDQELIRSLNVFEEMATQALDNLQGNSRSVLTATKGLKHAIPEASSRLNRLVGQLSSSSEQESSEK